MLYRKIWKLLLIASIIGFGNQLLYGEEITESFKVKPGGKLTIVSDLGSIEILTSGKNRVEIEITKESKFGIFGRRGLNPEDFHISIKQSANDVTIVGKTPGRRGWDWNNNDLKVHYKITVPTEYSVDLSTSGGSISIADLQGTVIAETSGGGIQLGKISGAVRAETSGGSIRLDGSGHAAYLQTSGGSIKVGLVKGDLRATTSGGPIHIDEVGGQVSANTSGGSISAYLSRQPEDDCRLSTSGGSITIYLAEGIGLDLNASTSGGKVYVDMPITTRGSIGHKSIRGTINGGGPDLDVHTSGGSIKILNR